MNTQTQNEIIKNTLQDLSLEYLGEDATEFINCLDELDEYTDTHQIFDDLHNNGFFDVEIIYYSKAIEYLQENDPSLCESLEIAEEYDFNLQNLNSEALASLHASRDRETKFWEDVAPKLNELI